MLPKESITVIIPCHNEEKMISMCVESCLNQTRKPDQILVVNDGSTDKSDKILRKYEDKITIINIPEATGNKSRALEIGLRYVTSTVVVATDGDTILDPNFIELIYNDFEKNPNVSVVAGYVQSMRYNFMTALREVDYTIGQDVHKLAQSYAHFILVIPGCAGAFKTELFKNGSICFDHDTLTEDLDFTYKLNTLGLKIIYNNKAKVYTQDPPTLISYINQMRRWHGGAWQNLKKHYKIFFNKPNAALIFSLSYLEGFFFGITIILLPLINISLSLVIFTGSLFVCVALGLYASIRKRRIDLLLVSPLLVFITILNSYIFLEQFTKEIILRKKNMVWFHPERRIIFNYSIKL